MFMKSSRLRGNDGIGEAPLHVVGRGSCIHDRGGDEFLVVCELGIVPGPPLIKFTLNYLLTSRSIFKSQ